MLRKTSLATVQVGEGRLEADGGIGEEKYDLTSELKLKYTGRSWGEAQVER